MVMKVALLTLVMALSLISVNAQKSESSKLKSEIPTVSLCELISNPDFYDEKEVRFRATFITSPLHLVSAFNDNSCSDEKNLTWVEFDGLSVKSSSQPEVMRKLEKEVLFPEANFVMSSTEMLVVGIFHKPKESGYGRENKYRFMVTLKRVEEVGDTKRL